MKSAFPLAVMILWSGLSIAQESPKNSEAIAKDTASKGVETVTAAAKSDSEEEFVPPPGFKTKKRGKITLYCIQDSTVGTRFKTEKCYDREQIKAYMLAREQNNRDFDQRRAICQNPKACGMP